MLFFFLGGWGGGGLGVWFFFWVFGVGVFCFWGLGPVVLGLLGFWDRGSLYKHRRINLGKMTLPKFSLPIDWIFVSRIFRVFHSLGRLDLFI